MFGIGLPELIVILIIALVVVGPERLPELGRQVGRVVRDLRRVYMNLRSELGPEFDDIERGIQDLRQLDPRRQIGDFSRSMLDDLSKDAPELKQAANAPKLDLTKLSRGVLADDLLEKPLRESRSEAPTNGTATTPAASANGQSADAPRNGKPEPDAEPSRT